MAEVVTDWSVIAAQIAGFALTIITNPISQSRRHCGQVIGKFGQEKLV